MVPHIANLDEWEAALNLLLNNPPLYSSKSKLALARSKLGDINKSNIIDKLIFHLNNHIKSTSNIET